MDGTVLPGIGKDLMMINAHHKYSHSRDTQDCQLISIFSSKVFLRDGVHVYLLL